MNRGRNDTHNTLKTTLRNCTVRCLFNALYYIAICIFSRVTVLYQFHHFFFWHLTSYLCVCKVVRVSLRTCIDVLASLSAVRMPKGLFWCGLCKEKRARLSFCTRLVSVAFCRVCTAISSGKGRREVEVSWWIYISSPEQIKSSVVCISQWILCNWLAW